ncbi:hypothetical protein LPTSP3_g15240 [Leptospira kobayashii]|uniref:Uncharacterized protein n=1 Tax=Leptospira kobayashii TaxID=1917830 RepID=A0ABN6KE41_9LEPT|nr:hypothetical protein [Leptospira kobayashii]BDA78594.1 hypothetical protein LPTSP3_g15240 [Leptospira kobayashii]
MGNSFFKSIIIFFVGFSLQGLEAQTTTFYNEFWDGIAEDVFLSPQKKEETEIGKRVREKNFEEIKNLRSFIKNRLVYENTKDKILAGNRESKVGLIQDLESLPDLGGFLWYRDNQTILRWGDWSDFYEDGFSAEKIRLEGQLPSFRLGNDEFYFFAKNMSGYSPVDFRFIGWESTFYVFGDDGSLRFSNDSHIDKSLRVSEFRKTFETIREKIPGCEILEENDLKIFIIPAKNHPIYYVLYGLRLFLYVWTVYLFWVFLNLAFPNLKKHLPPSPPETT